VIDFIKVFNKQEGEMEIGITFASVHEEYEKSILSALDGIANEGYKLMELAPDDRIGNDELRKALSDRGIRALAGHLIIDRFNDDQYDESMKFAEFFGFEYIVLPWCYPDSIKDYETTVKTAEKVEALANRVAKSGFKLLFHNHWMEFEDVYEGKCVQDILFENTSNLGFELDIGWAYAGGCDVVPYINKLGERLKIVHIKDIHPNDNRLPVEIGTGAVNIKECLDAASAVGVKYGIVEQDVTADKRELPAFESIRLSRSNLHKMGY
jgi:sugar phosphate isomerase/epimerase